MTTSTRPAPPRDHMVLDQSTFELVVPRGAAVELPSPAPGYATCVTDEGRRYCAWLDAAAGPAEQDHEIFIGTDGDREFKLIVRNDDTRAVCVRDDPNADWSAPVELAPPSEVCS